jgi:hypothetical protein
MWWHYPEDDRPNMLATIVGAALEEIAGTRPSFASGSVPSPWREKSEGVCRTVQNGLDDYPWYGRLEDVSRVTERLGRLSMER